MDPGACRCSTVRVVRILVTGGAGMIGGKLAQQLARDGSIGGKSVAHLLLADVVEPEQRLDAGFEVETVVADLARPGVAGRLVSNRPEIVFHLAAVVSGEAEADVDKGYRVNLDGTRCLLDAIRGLDRDYVRVSSSPRRSRCSAHRSPT